jgi:hypothetical protein
MALPKPTPELVKKSVARFDSDERYGVADRLLARVFSDFPENRVLEQILGEVALLNSLYSTRVFAVVAMAKHILESDIDVDLSRGSPSLVNRVARLTIRGKSRVHYSFASKYCSWHQPALFPIFDNQVEKALWAYQRVYKFAAFRKPDLRDYETFKGVVGAFQQRFGLAGCSLREIDKLLWFVGGSGKVRAG